MRVITPNATYIQRSDLYYLDMVRFPIPADLRDKYDQDTRKREYDYQPQPIDTTKFYKISNETDKKYDEKSTQQYKPIYRYPYNAKIMVFESPSISNKRKVI